MDGWMGDSEREGDSESDHMTPCTVGRSVDLFLPKFSTAHYSMQYRIMRIKITWVTESISGSRLTFNLTFADHRSLLF